MDTASIALTSPQGYQNAEIRELCTDVKAQRKYRADDTWANIPRTDGYGVGIEHCWIDIWGEETCSIAGRFRERYREDPKVSCRNAFKENPELFNSVRERVELESWTFTEMKKAMQWMFNCFGKLPPKVCRPATTQN